MQCRAWWCSSIVEILWVTFFFCSSESTRAVFFCCSAGWQCKVKQRVKWPSLLHTHRVRRTPYFAIDGIESMCVASSLFSALTHLLMWFLLGLRLSTVWHDVYYHYHIEKLLCSGWRLPPLTNIILRLSCRSYLHESFKLLIRNTFFKPWYQTLTTRRALVECRPPLRSIDLHIIHCISYDGFAGRHIWFSGWIVCDVFFLSRSI